MHNPTRPPVFFARLIHTVITTLLTTILSTLAIPAAALPAEDQRPPGLTGETWQFGPLNRWAYTHIQEILPTKVIRRSSAGFAPLQGLETAANDLLITLNGESVQLSKALRTQYVDGILVMKDGRVVTEIYDGTLTPERTHLMWSVSKTITGLTAASVAADGLIDLEKTVADYVPELAGSGWGPDTLRTLLDQRDGSNWTEDYAAPNSTVRRQDCADGLLTGQMCANVPVVGNYVFLPKVGRLEARKGSFVYKSGTTDVIAWVLEAATGKRFADLVAERIWGPMGAERDAGITVDVGGFTLASGGMFATLRDIARIGLLIANHGKAGGTQVVPTAWIDDLFAIRDTPYYRSFIWGVGDGRGTVQARGVHGQYIHVAPSSGVVIAMFSSWPDADGGAEGVGSEGAQALLSAIEVAVQN
jgi:hypothetical protein